MFKHPFDHVVIDNFIDESLAQTLSNEFPKYEDNSWFYYNSPLENKKACNDWYKFPKTTYQFFTYLNSPEFIDTLKSRFNIHNLYADPGLHGAGWHMHRQGGKLNVHLDYSMHPKLQKQRKLNLILYLSPNWDPIWGGNLELWSHNHANNRPLKIEKTVNCQFNRAVIFDTTQNSWHGFADPLICPEDQYRKSIAMYYLIDPPEDVDTRFRALYAPSEDQKNNPEIEKLIEIRSK